MAPGRARTRYGLTYGGQTQERTVGIGLIESLILSESVPPEIRPAVDNVIWNQLIYVAYHGDIGQKHENVNARRLIRLVEQCPDKQQLPQYSEEDFAEIRRRANAAS